MQAGFEGALAGGAAFESGAAAGELERVLARLAELLVEARVFAVEPREVCFAFVDLLAEGAPVAGTAERSHLREFASRGVHLSCRAVAFVVD